MSEIPETEQGLINYKNYCEREFRNIEKRKRRLEKLYKECEEKLKEIQE